ncbi:MAG: hypothetical protein AABY22_36525 [Nanoarchaeota archaeon]
MENKKTKKIKCEYCNEYVKIDDPDYNKEKIRCKRLKMQLN